MHVGMSRGAPRAQRPRRPPASTCCAARSSASTSACRRTRTAGGSRWPGCGRPKATSPARSSCSTRRSACTPATSPRTCGRSRRCGPGCGWRRAGSTTRCAWARERGLSADDELSYLREFEHVTLARVLLARVRRPTGRSRRSTEAAAPPRAPAAGGGGRRTGRQRHRDPGAAGARAPARAATPRPRSAPLRRALTLAEPEGYVRIFVDEGPPMAALLRASATAGDRRGSYVRRLLDAPATGRR